MITKVDHIGFAVKDLEQASQCFAKLLDVDPSKSETVETEQVNISFFELDDTKLELLEASSDQSVIHEFLKKRREGMHHIALYTTDLLKEIARLKSLGFDFVDEVPKVGADQKKVVFLHPRSTHGILVELCQDISPKESHAS